jgi:hypothetical protein
MYENSTLSQVLQYVYDDCTPAEQQKLERQLAKNDRLYYATAEVMALQRKISAAALEPKQSTIDNIMAYAKRKSAIAAPAAQGEE